jgi:hypothetical protein
MGKIDLTERVRRRAYEIWESESRPHGLAQVHWLRAESEIGEGLKSPKSGKKPTKPIAKPAPKSAVSSRSPLRSSKKRPPKK